MCIGGPALIYYVMPSEEELFLVRLISGPHDLNAVAISDTSLQVMRR